jgi:antitoxin PrlF
VEPTEDDPIVGTFLAFLEREMRAHPGAVTPLSAADIQGLDELLDGVLVDRDEDLVDFTLP